MSAPLDRDGLVRELLQQQTALLELQRETVHLQRLLMEHLLGRAPTAAAPPESEPDAAPEPAPRLQLVRAEPPPPPEPPVTPEPETPPQPNDLDQPPAPQATTRAARYLRGPSAGPRATRPVTRRDVERITRLYEAGDAAHLVVQFGPYKGATLLQVAELDPDYVRRLALSAQRPQVRAAARQVAAALDASPSTSESTFRTRVRPRRGG